MEELLTLLRKARAFDNLVIIAGNGGSLVNAIHFELHLQEYGVRAISLTNSAILTARANDFGPNIMFSASVSALGREGDLLIAISGSGASPNILQAVKTATARHMTVIGISFTSGCPLLLLSNTAILLPSKNMGAFEDDVSVLSHTFSNL